MFFLRRTTLRVFVPLCILFLSSMIGLIKFSVEIHSVQIQGEKSATDFLKIYLAHFQSTLQHMIFKGDSLAVQKEIQLLLLDTNFHYACLLDEQNRNIYSARKSAALDESGQIPLDELMVFHQVRRSQKGIIVPSADENILSVAYPLLLESRQNKDQFSRPGILHIRYDTTKMKQDTIANAMFDLLFGLALFILLAICIWILFYFILTRPVNKLILTARAFAEGDMQTRCHLQGIGEIAQIAQAFDELADRISMNQKHLKNSKEKFKKLNENLERMIAKRTKALEKSNLKLTEEINRAQAAEFQLRKFSRAVEQSPTGIMITDTAGHIEYVNPRFCSMTGYSSAEVIGRNPRLLKSGEMPQHVYEQLWATISAGQVWQGELKNVNKDGQPYWISASIAPVKNENGEVTHYIAIQEEITARRQSDEMIRMLAQAIQSVSELVSITDMNDNILFANNSFLKTYGYTQEEVLGRHISLVRSDKNPAEKVDRILRETLVNGWQGELINKKKDGTDFPIFLSTSVILDENWKPFALIGVSMDLTVQKRTEENTKKAEMLRTVQELAGAVSHEFSQPLQALSNYLSLLKITPQRQDYIDKSEQMVWRITELVNNLREITSIRKQDYLSTQIMDLKASATDIETRDHPKILVVDDEHSIRETMVEMLRTAGYNCEGASDGLEALQLLNRNGYHLILSDINMPKMNGSMLFSKAKAIGYKGYFVFMTGYAINGELEKIIKSSDGFINKPVNFEHLLKMVRKYVGEPDKTLPIRL